MGRTLAPSSPPLHNCWLEQRSCGINNWEGGGAGEDLGGWVGNMLVLELSVSLTSVAILAQACEWFEFSHPASTHSHHVRLIVPTCGSVYYFYPRLKGVQLVGVIPTYGSEGTYGCPLPDLRVGGSHPSSISPLRCLWQRECDWMCCHAHFEKKNMAYP